MAEKLAAVKKLALTPPMGWSSWNCFAVEISEYLVKDIADTLIAAGMREAGYRYINLDDGWMSKRRDRNGDLEADPEKFPSGMKALSDYLHARGLKIGLYGDGGTMTCQRYPGNLDHEQRDADLFASWEIDYFKEDWCYSEGLDKEEKYSLMRECLDKAGRPIIFSICTASFPGPWVTKVGHLWRTTRDITNNWASVPELIDTNAQYAGYAGSGHWNDPDMLQIGNGGMTVTECRSHMGMWAVMAAPLIAGNDLRGMSAEIQGILTAPEVIAVDQDPLGIQGTRVSRQGEGEVWAKPLKGGHVVAALFNRGPTDREITARWSEIGYPGSSGVVRDLWKRRDLGTYAEGFTALVGSHDTLMLCVFPEAEKSNVPPECPGGLRCEGMENPPSVFTAEPWLSWKSPGSDLAHRQSAYRLLLCDDEKALSEDAEILWDSGRVPSLDPWTRYSGPDLTDGKTYFWKVRVWDQWDQASPFSDTASFTVKRERRRHPSKPTGLAANGESDPMGLTGFPPVLSWEFRSPAADGDGDSGDYQTAFRLLVSDSEEKLAADRGTHWDTGQRYSTETQTCYGGQGLEPHKTYFWKVSTWGTARLSSPFSENASFRMVDAPGANLLMDGGYESGGCGWYGVTVTDRRIVSAEIRSGRKSLEMRSSPRFGRRTYQDVSVEGGKRYLVETWLKMVDAPENGVRLTATWLKNRVPKGAPLEPQTLRQDTIACGSGTGEWTRYGEEITAPPGSRAVRFQVTMDPTPVKATIWIDDNRLIELTG